MNSSTSHPKCLLIILSITLVLSLTPIAPAFATDDAVGTDGTTLLLGGTASDEATSSNDTDPPVQGIASTPASDISSAEQEPVDTSNDAALSPDAPDSLSTTSPEDSIETLADEDHPTGQEVAKTINDLTVSSGTLSAVWTPAGDGSNPYQGEIAVSSTGTPQTTSTLALDLALGITVVWRAELNNTRVSWDAIRLTGEGTFSVESGARISSTGVDSNGSAIYGAGPLKLEVKGGIISSTSGYGGQTPSYGTIQMEADSEGGLPSVIVSGGEVRAVGADGTKPERRTTAINFDGAVEMTGGIVSASYGPAICSGSSEDTVVVSRATVVVTGGEVSSVGPFPSIWVNYGTNVQASADLEYNVTVGGNATITSSVKDTVDYDSAINTKGGVLIQDNASLSSENGYVIRAEGTAKKITVQGGTLFCEGRTVVFSSTVGHVLTISGGSLKNGTSANAPVIDLDGADAENPYHITVIGNAEISAQGSDTSCNAIDVRYATVIIEGTPIISSAAARAVYAWNGTVAMSGGTVTTGYTGTASTYAALAAESVNISGGTITAARGPAVRISGVKGVAADSTITGGAITASAIASSNLRDFATVSCVPLGANTALPASLTIGGSASIESKHPLVNPDVARSAVPAVATTGELTVEGNATITGHTVGILLADEVVDGSRIGGKLVMNGGTVTSTADAAATTADAYRNAAIKYSLNASITINGGLVQATDVAHAISAASYNAGGTRISINGGEVKARTGYALYNNSNNTTVEINGGLLFAYGDRIASGAYSAALYQLSQVTIAGTGTVVVWDQAGGATLYTAHTATDILTNPASCPKDESATTAAVYWTADVTKGPGISYSNAGDGNSLVTAGFIPLAGITIQKADLTTADVSITGTYTYTGSPIIPAASEVTVKLDGITLTSGSDYSFSVSSGGTDAGAAELTITGLGNYTGAITKDFTIAEAPLTGSISIFENTNAGELGKVDVGDTLGVNLSSLLPVGAHPSLSYQWYLDGQPAGTGTDYTVPADSMGKLITVKVTASGNYTGEVSSDAVKVGFLPLEGTGTLLGATALGGTIELTPQLGAGTFEVTWLRNGVAIPGASGTSYTITKDDLGSLITARMVGTGDFYGEIASENTIAVPAVEPDSPVPTATVLLGSLSVSWDEPFHGGDAIQGYRASIDNGATWHEVVGTSHTFSGLTQGQSYTVRVLAYNGVGESSHGVVSAALPAPAVGPVITGSNPTSNSAGTGATLAATSDPSPLGLGLSLMIGGLVMLTAGAVWSRRKTQRNRHECV